MARSSTLVLLCGLSACSNPARGPNDASTEAIDGGVGDLMASSDGRADAPDEPDGADGLEETCQQSVCWRALSAREYPEALDPPQQALHCNERGAAAGCPLGTACGTPRVFADGRIVPVCEPVGDGLEILDLDVPGPGQLASDGQGVRVQAWLALNGDPFPARNEGSASWSSWLSFTHRATGAQVKAAVPDDPAVGLALPLRPGLHDVALYLRSSDFVSAAPDGVLRGELWVGGAGEVVIDLPVSSLEIALRFADSALTATESGLVRVVLEGEGGRWVSYAMSGADRGLADLLIPWDRYHLRVDVSPGLEGLFPPLPLEWDVPIDVPETRTVSLSLEPVDVRGTVTVDGQVPPQGGRLLLARGSATRSVDLSPETGGTFRTRVWAGQLYDVYYVAATGETSLVRSDWIFDGGALDLDIDTVEVAVRLDLGAAPPEQPELRLSMRHSQLPNGPIRRLEQPELDNGRLVYEVHLAPGQLTDVWLESWGGLPRGSIPLAEGVDLTEGATFRAELADLYIDLELRDPAGRAARIGPTAVELHSNGLNSGYSQRIQLNDDTPPIELPTYEGDYALVVWPGWGNELGMDNVPYLLGETTVEGPTALELIFPTARIEGRVTLGGASLAPAVNRVSRGQVTLLGSRGGHTAQLPADGPAAYQVLIGPDVFRVYVNCISSECQEAASAGSILLYDGVILGP